MRKPPMNEVQNRLDDKQLNSQHTLDEMLDKGQASSDVEILEVFDAADDSTETSNESEATTEVVSNVEESQKLASEESFFVNSTGRLDESMYCKYLKQVKTNFNQGTKVSDDGIYVSKLKNMCLEDFILRRSALCSQRHMNTCKECPQLINAAKKIISSGVCKVLQLYRKHFSSTYRSSNATQRFMQLPVVVFKLCPRPGMQKLYVIENKEGIDYQTLVSLIHKFSLQNELDKTGIAKDTLRDLCSLASTESDRRLIKFAVCKANTKAKEHLGIQQLTTLKKNVQSALEQAMAIKKEVTNLATARKMSALRCLGVYDCVSESESDKG